MRGALMEESGAGASKAPAGNHEAGAGAEGATEPKALSGWKGNDPGVTAESWQPAAAGLEILPSCLVIPDSGGVAAPRGPTSEGRLPVLLVDRPNSQISQFINKDQVESSAKLTLTAKPCKGVIYHARYFFVSLISPTTPPPVWQNRSGSNPRRRA
jgi:hypothetical protein